MEKMLNNDKVEQYVLSRVLQNSIKGAFYAFIQTEEIIDGLAELDKNENIIVLTLGDYCLIEVNPSYLINTINASQPDTFVKGDVDIITQRMADAVVEFEKFLVVRGKTTANFTGTIAIYNTNLSPTIMFNHVSYPAFRLSVTKVFQLLKLYGYQIKVGNTFVPVDIALENLQDFWKSTKMSPIKNGLFLNIRCGLSIEDMKQKEIELRQKYS